MSKTHSNNQKANNGLVNWITVREIMVCITKCGTGPHSPVVNMSGSRCECDCRSRGASSIPARAHTFVEIDHEIISTVIILPSAESFKKGCCQLQAKVCARSTG